MSLWLAILLGVVQGITEFLPISSTAHLRIAPSLLGQPDPGAAFTAVIQLGTLAAVVVYFARDLGRMIRGVFTAPGGPDARVAWLVVLGTLPIGVAGLLLKPYVTGPLRSLYVIAGTLAGVAVIMALVERRAHGSRTLDVITVSDAMWIGMAQACALVPGVSRSGATLTAALLIGLARPDAARFSFLLSIPAIGAAGVFEMKDALALFGEESLVPLVVATVVSAVAGYASIAWLMAWLRTRSLVPFAIYRVLLAILLLILCLTGVIAA